MIHEFIMNKLIQKYNKPGEYKVEIFFKTAGEQKEWLGIVDARKPGQYRLEVAALHTAAETGGKITVRGVVGKGATLDITGMIKISRAAWKVDDFLELRVLLLDPLARATVEPKLEIEADDVRASHAASVGKIDETQLLYLMTRGISREAAEMLVIQGFLQV